MLSRRGFIRSAALVGAGMFASPYILRGSALLPPAPTRLLGRTGFATPLFSLGGQASLQWTGPGIDPVAIIVKAYETGVRYFDTSNVYGPSQVNYGRAFRQLGLVPGAPNYDEQRRRNVFIATKSGIRSNRGKWEGVGNSSNGKPGSTVVDDLYRSFAQLFGDAEGNFSAEAYLDSVQLHAIGSRVEVDAAFEGYANPSPQERIGSLAVLRDFRDGTDRTGMNPRQLRLLRHIGITGHKSSDALMYALWLDTENVLDTLLVPANANDRRYLSHINNVIPVAAAKGMGVIAMKVFANGAIYRNSTKADNRPQGMVLTIGSPELPSARLLQYPLSMPGITTSIIGTGCIDQDPEKCQLTRNWRDSQIEEPVSRRELARTEELAGQVVGGETNYYQEKAGGLRLARDGQINRIPEGTRLTWNCALAGPDPIISYEVLRDGRPVGQVSHRPQTTLQPFNYVDPVNDRSGHAYQIKSTDAAGNFALSAPLVLESSS
jgi:aryl-alcohol dehydrogenase-like predicted oxidoreductase